MNYDKLIQIAAGIPKIQTLVTDSDIIEWIDIMSGCFTDKEAVMMDRAVRCYEKDGYTHMDIEFHGRCVATISPNSTRDRVNWQFNNITNNPDMAENIISYVIFQTICTLMHTDLWREPGLYPLH